MFFDAPCDECVCASKRGRYIFLCVLVSYLHFADSVIDCVHLAYEVIDIIVLQSLRKQEEQGISNVQRNAAYSTNINGFENLHCLTLIPLRFSKFKMLSTLKPEAGAMADIAERG
jgi:hypothetical protein